jgi:serine protease Do
MNNVSILSRATPVLRRRTQSVVLRFAAALLGLALAAPALAQREGAEDPADKFRDAVRDALELMWVPSSRYSDGPPTRQAFREVVAEARLATVEVRRRGRRVAIGGIVGPDGWIVTKASLAWGELTCRLADRRELSARVVGIDRERDLAMLKVEARGLATLDLGIDSAGAGRLFVSADAGEGREKKVSSAQPTTGDATRNAALAPECPLPGEFVATVGLGREPLAIGVVSVGPRAVPGQPGILGIRMEEKGVGGVLIGQVYPGTGAARAGIEAGDLVLEIEGVAVESLDELKAQVQRYNPGDRVAVLVQRGERRLVKVATLSRLLRDPGSNRALYQNSLGGELTDRRFGFPSALQHDTVVGPNECGGPIVDLDGRVVGFNIARAGRTESYALPTAEVASRLLDLMSGRLAPAGVGDSE